MSIVSLNPRHGMYYLPFLHPFRYPFPLSPFHAPLPFHSRYALISPISDIFLFNPPLPIHTLISALISSFHSFPHSSLRTLHSTLSFQPSVPLIILLPSKIFVVLFIPSNPTLPPFQLLLPKQCGGASKHTFGIKITVTEVHF